MGTLAVGGGALAATVRPVGAVARRGAPGSVGQPALLGGTPVRKDPFPSWPVSDALEERGIADVVRSGKWGRGTGDQVNRFETAYAALTGAKHCLATANGTSALLTVLRSMDVGPGDEVIVPPYTFVATINVVLSMYALPVFVDTDIETFQIDARKVAGAITPKTRVVMPVHLGGAAADLETIASAASGRNVPIVEDACQSHLAEWKGRKVGTFGRAGCFSFQASKNLNCGEGGAILTNDRDLVERCYAFHNNSRGRRVGGADFSYHGSGLNLRLTELQASLLLSQMTRLEKQSAIRDANGAYLTARLREIPGIAPARMYDGCTRNAYHLYMFRYDKEAFAGLSREAFLKALRAEGIPASGGYTPLNTSPVVEQTLSSPGYRRIYSDAELSSLRERNRCPQNDRLCTEAVWLTQTMLLGPRRDMDQIVEAITKIRQHAKAIATAS
jgi:dTDP-4-amino-4,6-dideoxygalactose transaminase